MKIKKKKINFTVPDDVFAVWQQVSDDLVERRVFRNKTEIFDSMVYFLQRAKKEEVLEFKSKSMII